MRTWGLDTSTALRCSHYASHYVHLRHPLPTRLDRTIAAVCPLILVSIRKRSSWLLKIAMTILVTLLHTDAHARTASPGNAVPDAVGTAEMAHFSRHELNKRMLQDNNELIIKFKSNVPHGAMSALHESLGSKKTKAIKSLALQRVQLRKGYSVRQAAEDYRKSQIVEYAEPNFLVTATRTPNDSEFNGQWGLKKIDAPAAWDSSIGSDQVVVGVIDTGIDYNHPDLADNVWRRPASVPDGYSDDENNSYANIVYGINTNNGTSNPMDDNGHGTHVAGIIGATGNNFIGVSGANWSIKILTCKFLDVNGYGYLFDALACLDFVREMKERGVNLVATNNSWEIEGGFESSALLDAVEAQRVAGILFVASAGNDSSDNDRIARYPATIDKPNLISVAAMEISDIMAQFSNYGRRTVHIGAPGQSIISSYIGGTYEYLSGTSMAAPHVTGVAALLKAQDMSRDWVALKNRILSGGKAFPSLHDMTISGRLVNAYGSMACSSTLLNAPLLTVLKFPTAPVAGTAYPLAALSINCDRPYGFDNDAEARVTLSTGGSITLKDDDRDGIYTGTWTPTSDHLSDVVRLTFTSPAGSETVATPSVKGKGFFTAPTVVTNDSYIFLNHQAYGSVTLSATGGAPPVYLELTGRSIGNRIIPQPGRCFERHPVIRFGKGCPGQGYGQPVDVRSRLCEDCCHVRGD
ncbi:thermophilic serine proteinase [Geobacter sp. OR-1]|uniref:S8 family peptidase n=1 Tax=Geobacter sp. OR-1 TaxID=1266765 RepID=UPI000541954D|nr:S8 family peptidase [Geobacter sp. OR-1]GAM08733.1 thermophilic serine proteinase [Geobacter sp. OR-1]